MSAAQWELLMRYASSFVALMALAACQQEPDAGPVVADRAPAPTAEASAQPTPVPSDKAVQILPQVTLSADGIMLVGAVEGRGTATSLAFGRDKTTVLDVMAVDFGKPKLSRFEECGAGPMEFAAWGSFTLNFLDDKLVGWRAEKGARVVTVDGLQIGITLAEIKGERSARRVPGTTLEGEFNYASGDGGTIGGFLDGNGDGAKVASLHAGVNCFFR